MAYSKYYYSSPTWDAPDNFVVGYQSQRALPQNWKDQIAYFKGVAAVAYAEWVFSPENEWLTDEKMEFGISALKQICELASII